MQNGFTRLPDSRRQKITIHFEGEPVVAFEGETVAAALLAAGRVFTRTTPVSGTRRGPFCMMGACFDCLMEIDGKSNQQGCMTAVREGLRVRRMRGARQAAAGDSND